MKIIRTLSFILFLVCSCERKEEQNVLLYNTDVIAILDASKLELRDVKGKVELTTEDIDQIEILLKASVAEYNREIEKSLPELQARYPESRIDESWVHIMLENYKRQYIPYLNSRGEKKVWIYCTINKRVHSKWKSELMFAAGGGNNYFEVTVNLSARTFKDFRINGPA